MGLIALAGTVHAACGSGGSPSPATGDIPIGDVSRGDSSFDVHSPCLEGPPTTTGLPTVTTEVPSTTEPSTTEPETTSPTCPIDHGTNCSRPPRRFRRRHDRCAIEHQLYTARLDYRWLGGSTAGHPCCGPDPPIPLASPRRRLRRMRGGAGPRSSGSRMVSPGARRRDAAKRATINEQLESVTSSLTNITNSAPTQERPLRPTCSARTFEVFRSPRRPPICCAVDLCRPAESS